MAVLLLSAFMLLPVQSLMAANATWKTSPADALWSNAANWSAAVPGAGNTATFGASSITTIDLGGGIAISNITFASGAAAYTIGSGGVNGQTLTLSDAGLIITSSTGTNEIFNARLVFDDAATSYGVNPVNGTSGANQTKTLTFAGDISGGNGAGLKTLTLKPSTAGPGLLIVSGVISDGTAGQMTVSKTFGGTLTLSGANTYTGDTTMSSGTLELGNVNALQNSTLDTGASGAQKVTFVVAGNNTYNLGGLKGADALALGGNVINVGGNGQSTAFAGVISGAGGGLIKSGVGTLTLSDASTYTGNTTISNGVLALSGSGSLASTSITNYGTFDVSAVSGGYHLLGGKTLAGNNSVIGPVTVDSGATLTVGGGSGTAGIGTLSVTGDLTLNGTTVLRLNKGGASDQIMASGTLTLGGTLNLNSVGAALVDGDQIQIFSAGNTGSPVITGSPGAGLEWDGSLLNSSGIIKVVSGSTPPAFAVALTNQTVECGGNVSFYALANGTSPLVYTWKVNGVIVQSGTDLTTYTTNNVHAAGNVYTVSVEVANGFLPNATNSCTLTVADTLGPVITVLGSNPMSLLVGQTFTDPGATATDSCAGTITPTVSGTVDNNTAGVYVITYTAGDGDGNTNMATRTVNVVDHLSGVWTNTAGGTVQWMDAANWTNGIVAQGRNGFADFGKVNIGANTSLRLTQPLTIGGMAFNDTSGSSTWFLGNAGDPANILTMDSNDGTTTVAVNTDTSFGLEVAGTNKLVKTGTAMLTLTRSNSYSGGTLLSAGSIKYTAVVADSIFGYGAVTVADGGQIWDNISGASNRVWMNNFTIGGDGGSSAPAGANTGAIYLNSAATITMGGTLTLSTNARIASANSTGIGYIFNGNINLDTYTLTLKGGSSSALQTGWAINGNISSGSGGGLTWLLSNVESMLTLTGSNTYSGFTTNYGVLCITTTNALPGWDTSGRYFTRTGGTLMVGNAVDDVSVSTILGTGNFAANTKIGFDTSAGNRTCPLILADTGAGALGLTKNGNNMLTLTSVNTYTGATKVNGGTLAVNGSIASGAVTVMTNATLAGYGQINGPVTFQDGAILNLGSSAGVLTINNSLMLQTNSILTNSLTVMKLAKGSSPSNDLVTGISTLTYGGTLTVTTNVGMTALVAGDSFQLFQATNYAGAFAATNLPSLPSNLGWVWSGASGTLSVIAVGTSQPVISSVVYSGGNLLLSGSNGTPSTSYIILSSTNVALPLASWIPVQTNFFDAGGNFTANIPVNNSVPQKFFLLKQ